METFAAISGIRAIRAFDGRELDRSDLDRILAAGRRAPSSKNSQRWGFVACREREHLRALAEVGQFAGHIAGAGAAVAIVTPTSDDPGRRQWIMLDAGQAAQNMMLAAWDIGVGSAHAAVYDQEIARAQLGYPEDHRCDLIISFGYPADRSLLTAPPRTGGRRPASDVVHWERW
jgi:nitroreductase